MELTKIYPFNIVDDIFFGQKDALSIYIPGLLEEISKLDEKQVEILKLRYIEKKTLKECGEIFGVSAYVIRSIQVKALRLLQHPSRSRFFLAVSKAEFLDLYEKYYSLEKEYENLKKAYENDVGEELDPKIILKRAELELTSLLESNIYQLGLSVRSHNALKRAGKVKIKDVTNMTFDEILKIRNMGITSANEVKNILKDRGLSLSERQD